MKLYCNESVMNSSKLLHHRRLLYQLPVLCSDYPSTHLESLHSWFGKMSYLVSTKTYSIDSIHQIHPYNPPSHHRSGRQEDRSRLICNGNSLLLGSLEALWKLFLHDKPHRKKLYSNYFNPPWIKMLLVATVNSFNQSKHLSLPWN